MRSLYLVAFAAFLVTGCLSATQATNQAQNAGTTSGGSSGSGGSGSGTGSGTTGAPAPNAAGLIQGFDADAGLVRGYAYNPASPNTSYTVELWLDNPRPAGTSLGTTVANLNRFLFPTGLHGFSLTLPAMYQDGRLRQVYAYAIDGAAKNELGGSPMGFWVGTNTAAKAYWQSTVRPSLNATCLGCHELGGSGASDYNYTKSLLASPTKFTTGTQTNNELINRGVGINHGGGNRCGSVSQGVCGLMQTWWTMEFN